MSDGWLSSERYEHVPVTSCTGPGTYLDSAWKIVTHTTESRPGSIDAVRALFQAQPCSAPHFIIDPLGTRRRIQLIPWTWSACALRPGRPCDMETNRWRAVQVEICGFAAESPTWSDEVCWGIAEWIADVIADGCPINLDNVPDYPAMTGVLATESSPYRLGGEDFRLFDGLGSHVMVGCPVPETPVLCADLVWRPIGSLYPGDELVAFDEHSPGTREAGGRRFRTATVLDNELVPKPCVRIVTDRTEVTVSTDHKWLCRTGERKDPWHWKRTDELEPGNRIGHLVEPWATDGSREAGWLAGLYDADGCLVVANPDVPGRASQNWMLAFDQLDGQLLADFDAAMLGRGFDVWKYERAQRFADGFRRRSMQTRRLQDRRSIMRALGSLRPTRLLRHPNLRAMWEGAVLGKIARTAEVLAVESVGMRDVSAVRTDTHTYVASGLLSHNCNDHWDWGRADGARIARFAKDILAGAPSIITTPPDLPPDGNPVVVADVLGPGDEGQAVVFLQSLLRGLGFDPGPSDGVFGPRTTSAVRLFQADRGLDVDGLVGPATTAALAGVYAPLVKPPIDAPAVDAVEPECITEGMEGGIVTFLQELLVGLGYDPGPVDGIFGPATAGAVRLFQADQGLTVDGIAGPDTLAAIARVYGNGPTAGPSTPWPGRYFVETSPPMTGADVAAWQEASRTLTVDGVYGLVSRSICERIQTVHGLAVDGIVGPATWNATWMQHPLPPSG